MANQPQHPSGAKLALSIRLPPKHLQALSLIVQKRRETDQRASTTSVIEGWIEATPTYKNLDND